MKKKGPNVLFVICLIVLIIAVATGVIYKVSQNQRGDVYEELADHVIPELVSVEHEEAVTDTEQESEIADMPVDFAALQEENEDIYAWIQIEGTDVNYPILQSPGDDDYYLDHTVKRQEGLPGSIYTQYNYNSGCFEDPVTVLYGHNMRDGSMFAAIKKYIDEEFRDAHPQIQIYTPEHILTYRVVCAITYDDRHILQTYNCYETEKYEALLKSLQTERMIPSWLEEPFTVTAEDRMILLSTCNSNSDQRFIVGAVLINEE